MYQNDTTMKTFVVSCLILVRVVTNAQSIGLRYGHSLTPADHLSLRYEHWTNSLVNLSITAFLEKSRFANLNYSCYGADLSAEYSTARGADALPLFSFRGGAGGTWQTKNEPWLYKELSTSKRMNYGLVAEVAVECQLTDVFRLSLFAQQKWLFKSLPGSKRCCFGLGLTYHLSSY